MGLPEIFLLIFLVALVASLFVGFIQAVSMNYKQAPYVPPSDKYQQEAYGQGHDIEYYTAPSPRAVSRWTPQENQTFSRGYRDEIDTSMLRPFTIEEQISSEMQRNNLQDAKKKEPAEEKPRTLGCIPLELERKWGQVQREPPQLIPLELPNENV